MLLIDFDGFVAMEYKEEEIWKLSHVIHWFFWV